MGMSTEHPAAAADATEVIRQFIPHSPFAALLGIALEEIDDGHVVLRMPFDASRTTFGDIVHGGAIATLIDVATMAAAWAGAPLPEKLRGVTVGLSTQFLDAARAEDLLAEGRVLRRGSTITTCEVEVRGEDGRRVAQALGTYKVG
jgi:uncharacterized protein (TIGR00369 family)